VNWVATIEYRDWPDKETIIGPIGAIAYHMRRNAMRISSVELLPQHEESPT
jgi:hypothetical protein